MQDGPLRRSVKRVALAVFRLDVFVTRAVRRRMGSRPFLLGGQCRRCARCCEAPAIQVGRLVWYVRSLQRAFLWWQSRVNGFELAGRHAGQRAFVFRCTHFDWSSRSCDSYASRPGICRDYPRALLSQAGPEMLPGCGYRPVAPNVDALLAGLRALPLTTEQEAQLKRGLFLEK